MRHTSKALLATATAAIAVLAPAAPAWSGIAAPLSITGAAVCISETEVDVTWTITNIDSLQRVLDIQTAEVISHGSLPVTVSPTTIAPTEAATGVSTLPEGPGTATLEVLVFENGGNSLRQFAGTATGTIDLPDCRQSTTTTTTTAVPTTTIPGTTTTTAAPLPAAPLPQTPTYTG